MPDRLIWIVILVVTMLAAGLQASERAAKRAAEAVVVVKVSTPWMVAQGKPTKLTGTVTLKRAPGVAVGKGHRARLQYRSGDDPWATLATAEVTAAGDGTGRVAFTFVPPAGRHAVRVVVDRYGTTAASNLVPISTTSGSVYVAKARHYMLPWCPSTPVTATLPRNGVYAGKAHNSWSEREEYNAAGGITTTYSWEQRIEFRPGLPDHALRAVAIHECAHIVQYRQFVNGTQYFLDRMKAVDELHGGNGKERQADCMAAIALKTMDYAVYTRECTAEQRKVAQQLWSDYGKKYQAAEYTFTRDR